MLELLDYSGSDIAVDDHRRFKQFLWLQIAFLLFAPIVLQVSGLFSPELYFVVSFVWFLSLSEVFAPENAAAQWWRRVQWVKFAGFVVLTYVVTQHVTAIIQ